jgi:hypothetical protein
MEKAFFKTEVPVEIEKLNSQNVVTFARLLSLTEIDEKDISKEFLLTF